MLIWTYTRLQSITAKLLAAGADPARMSTAQFDEHPVGSTALSIAASKGHDKIVAELLRAHPANASQAEELAAVRVQAMLRGHISRDAIQEAARVEWMDYYRSHGQYDKAIELAISQTEIDEIQEAKGAASFEASLKDVWGAPSAQDKPTSERPFITAVREHKWKAAEALAESAADLRDVEESKNRVEWMLSYSSRGEYDKALEMCITKEEVEAVERRRKQPLA